MSLSNTILVAILGLYCLVAGYWMGNWTGNIQGKEYYAAHLICLPWTQTVNTNVPSRSYMDSDGFMHIYYGN